MSTLAERIATLFEQGGSAPRDEAPEQRCRGAETAIWNREEERGVQHDEMRTVDRERRAEHAELHGVEDDGEQDEVGDEAGPAGLMRSATAATIVAVKVLEEQDVVLEMRIGLELFIASEDGAPSIGAALKELQQTPAQFVGDLIQRQHDA